MKRSLTLLVFASLFFVAGAAAAGDQTVALDVPSMFCVLCEAPVKKTLQKIDGVSKAQVSYDKKEAVVTFDDAKTSTVALMKATKDAGFPSTVKVASPK